MGTQPLGVIGLDQFVLTQKMKDVESEGDGESEREKTQMKGIEELFGSLETLKTAQCFVAQNILNRMKNDISLSKEKNLSREISSLSFLSQRQLKVIRGGLLQEGSLSRSMTDHTAYLLRDALEKLSEFQKELFERQKRDTKCVLCGVRGVELLANQFPVEVSSEDVHDDAATNVVIFSFTF